MQERQEHVCVFGNGAGLSTQTQSQSPGLLWPLAQREKKRCLCWVVGTFSG